MMDINLNSMKKIFLLLTVVSVFLSSCSQAEPEIYKEKDGSLLYYTAKDKIANLFVEDKPNQQVLIQVGVTTKSSVDRFFNVMIDPSSTATSNQYVIDGASLKIPANSYLGYIKVTGDFNNVLTTGSSLVIKLVSMDGGVIAGFDNIFTLNLFKKCTITDASLFDGTYKVTADQWEDYAVDAEVPVVYDPAFGTNKFKILATNNAYLKNAATAYMIATVDFSKGTVAISANELFDYGTSKVTISGTGTINTCTGSMNLKVNYGSSASNQTLNLVKK